MTHQELERRLRQARVLPIIVPQSVTACLETIEALAEGGVQGVEIVLRTPDALAAIEAGVRRFPSLLFGAGTVLSTSQYDQAAAAGAQFVISPGFSAELVRHAGRGTIPLVPGVQTASEVMAAASAGATLLKFYPSEPAGGVTVLADFGSVFPAMSFLPSGKITLDNLPKYATLRNVASVGGTWMHSGAKDRDEIIARMRRSLDILGACQA